MTIENRRQRENTQVKLRDLEQLYEKKRINQLKEEIARFEARTSTSVPQ